MRSPAASTFFYQEASGDRRPRHALRAEVAAYASHGGRGVRAEAAAFASLTRSSTRTTQAKRACSYLVRIVSPTILPRRYAPAANAQSSYLTLSGCQLLSQGGPGVRLARHQWRRQALRRQRCTARRIGGCDKHFECDDAQPDRFAHCQRGRDNNVRYARTIINAHHVS
jgi:hypothetical protein